MIVTNRRFKREKPSRDAKSLYIFCEGAKRECGYFNYFKEMDSRINVEVYKLNPHENNSPSGLLSIAKKCIVRSEDNPKPKYEFLENDEVWIVFDTDKDKNESRQPQICEVWEFCKRKRGWFVAQSNPCFEVWLHYHHCRSLEKPILKDSEKCSDWKEVVGELFPEGFDSRKHPLYIETAIQNAEKNFNRVDDFPAVGSTEVFMLAKKILPFVAVKLRAVLTTLEATT